MHKGVVAYSLVANHIPIAARVIGAHEHESHFVFDLLMQNSTALTPTIHSTDTHGTNNVNFAILHLFGYQFAPRYRDIYERMATGLYGFQHPQHYQDDVIKPIRKINITLICDEWDTIQRIMVSLAQKTTTQSIIVQKLNATARKNKTRQALWEYDHILRSIYLLDYIDSVPLRANVQRALNRGEQYHQLRRAVSYANFGKLRFRTDEEQQIWSECSRLLSNCIVYYNLTLLSRMVHHAEEQGDTQRVAMLRTVTPLAWQHINFYGRYAFVPDEPALDLDAMSQTVLASLPRSDQATL